MFRTMNRLLLGILALGPVVGFEFLPDQGRLPIRPDLPDTITHLLGPGEQGELPRDAGKLYRVPLKKGQLIHLSAKPIDADIALVWFDPGRNDLFRVDTQFYPFKTEHLFFVARVEGLYGVRIEDGSRGKRAGRYTLRVEDFRVADDRDRKNAQAEEAFYTGKGLFRQGSLKEGESDLRYAIQSWQDLGNKARQADAFELLGQLRDAAHDSMGALQSYQQSAALRIALRDFQGQANVLMEMATSYDAQGKFQQAEPLYIKELEIRRRLHDQSGEIAAVYNLARIEQSLGKYEKSLDQFGQAIEGFDRQKAWSLESQALIGRGWSYLSMGMTDLALDDTERALRLVPPSDLRNRAVVLTQKAGIYRDQGKMEEALSTADQALALRKQVRDTNGEGVTLSSLGTTYFRLNRFGDALNAFQRSTQIFREGGDRKDEIDSMVNLGWIHAIQDRTEIALKIFNDALLLAREGGNKPTEAKLLHGIAYTERKRGNPIAAMAKIDEAIAVAESLRSAAERRDLRVSFLADHQDLYGLKIELLMAQRSMRPGAGYAWQAFQASERARARGLYDALAEEQEQRTDPLVRPELLKEHQRLQDEINGLDQKLRRLDMSMDAKREGEARLRRLIGENEALEANMRNAGGWTPSLSLPPSLSLWEIQNRILDRETVLVEYYLGDDASFVWAVTPESFQGFEIECSDLRELARRVYQGMANGVAPAGEPKSAADLERLSGCVLGKVAHLLVGKRVLVVAHGELQKIPFSALLEPVVRRPEARKAVTLPYLVLHHQVVNVPSVSVLSILRKQRTARHLWKRFLSIVADPVYRPGDERLPREAATVARQRLPGQPEPYSLSRLLRSREEAQQVRSLVLAKSLGVDLASGFRATREWVKEGHLSDSRVVHFATHGVLNEAYPQLSGLVLSQFDRQGQRHDGLLRVHEIDDLKLDADLVVLSACQTALGKDVRGEGLVGLTQAFLVGGSSSVLVSLWEVDDRASAELMTQFYRYLVEGLPPAAALKSAQERMIEREPWRSPYYWSGFILQGEWKEVEPSRQAPRK
ncbi:MAG: CHAT domain-containing tetratricopeptide repeat protein [Thermoanaerobaculia bacterium]